MRYEVEQKFPVDDMGALEGKLAAMGATVTEPQTEADLYFAHPAREFHRTDEALRIRRKGPSNYLTYKGPKVDATTKTRREIDLALGPGGESAAAWAEMLEALGFARVAEVRKRRRNAHLPWQGRRVEVALDEVEELGSYAELELVAEADQLEAARGCIASLAQALGLSGGERRSYLELLLLQRSSPGKGK